MLTPRTRKRREIAKVCFQDSGCLTFEPDVSFCRAHERIIFGIQSPLIASSGTVVLQHSPELATKSIIPTSIKSRVDIASGAIKTKRTSDGNSNVKQQRENEYSLHKTISRSCWSDLRGCRSA